MNLELKKLFNLRYILSYFSPAFGKLDILNSPMLLKNNKFSLLHLLQYFYSVAVCAVNLFSQNASISVISNRLFSQCNQNHCRFFSEKNLKNIFFLFNQFFPQSPLNITSIQNAKFHKEFGVLKNRSS